MHATHTAHSELAWRLYVCTKGLKFSTHIALQPHLQLQRRCVSQTGPAYSLVRPRCDLVVPRIRLQLGNRAFSVAGPVTWNSLPLHNRSAPTDTSVLLFLLHWLFRRVRAANIVPRFCSNSSRVIAPYKLSFYYCYYYYYYYYYYYLLGETQCHAHGLWPAVIQPGIALVGRFDCLHTVIHVIHHSTTTTAKIKWCY